MSVNGLLAGLVAITAPCAFVDTWAALVIGTVAGVLVCVATFALERVKVDDPVGAVPVHFFNGIWGVVALGLFASGNPDTAAWNGVATPVTGLLYGGGFGQLLAQLTQVVSIGVLAVGLSWVFFRILNAVKVLRSAPADELAGLDLPEMGAPGYTNDDLVMHGGMPGSRIRGALSPTRALGTTVIK
jgi:Amt family ammonium transporter